MALSAYHKMYSQRSDKDIAKRVAVKEEELRAVFDEVPFDAENEPVKIAVLGYGDKRFVAHHKRIFERVLESVVDITTFDITIDHLAGEDNIAKHDCTLPLPNAPYDITYSHILLPFIEREKQFDVIKNSYDALSPGGIAIHVLDRDEIKAKEPRLPYGLWSVPLEKWKEKLTELEIEYQEISVQYGVALVLLRTK